METWYITKQIVLGVGKILSGAIPASRGLVGPLGIAREIKLTIPRGSRDALEAVMEIDEVIRAPVEAGASYGQLSVKIDGRELLNESLVALESVEEAGFFARLWDRIVLFFAQLFSS